MEPTPRSGGNASKSGTTQAPKAAGKRPAPGLAKPGPTRSKPEKQQQLSSEDEKFKLRRRLTWTAIVGFLLTNILMFFRFFFPRTLFEPSSRFRIGYPSDFGLGVDERFKQSHRIWVVRQPDKLFVVFAKCTHLGCTPNWIETENKFKCPCHGSGYDIEGRNFEGPAPRPMDRTLVTLDAEGQIVVDTSRLYQCPPGAACEFEVEEGSYLVV